MCAQIRTLARHIKLNVLPPLARDAYRWITISPIALWREHRALQRALAVWDGRLLLLLPAPSTGGAERMLADVSATFADNRPLLLFTGDAADEGLLPVYQKYGINVKAPFLARHPLTRSTMRQHLASALAQRTGSTVLGSLSTFFFDLLPQLPTHVRTIYIQHAFLHQPGGNKVFRERLALFGRIDHLVFVARNALAEFDRFLFTNNVPNAQRARSVFIPNVVHAFHAPEHHSRIGVLFVGRDSPEKRAGLFVQLARELQAELPGAFTFTLVGPAPTSDTAPAQALGLETDTEKLSALYRANDVLVLTSEREGFPMVIMEAMAHGLAVISTPVGDVPERLHRDHAVVTSSVEARQALAEMKSTLCAFHADRALLERMRSAAFAEARRSFDADAFARAYRSLVTTPRAAS